MSMLEVCTVMAPPRGIASRALTIRFRRTCSIWLSSAWMQARPGASLTWSSTSSPRSPRSIFSSSEILALRSSICGWTHLAPADGEQSPDQRRRALAGLIGGARALVERVVFGQLVEHDLTEARTAPSSRLLKSWAIPPASRPTASILVACSSRCSSFSFSSAARRFLSVMSLTKATAAGPASLWTWLRLISTGNSTPSLRRAMSSRPWPIGRVRGSSK